MFVTDVNGFIFNINTVEQMNIVKNEYNNDFLVRAYYINRLGNDAEKTLFRGTDEDCEKYMEWLYARIGIGTFHYTI